MDATNRMRAVWVATAALVVVVMVGACTSSRSGSASASARPDAFRGPGPYVVGNTTLHLADRPVEIWYPAERGTETGKPKAVYNTRSVLPPAIASLLPGDLSPDIVEDAYRDLPASHHGPFPVVLFSHGYAGYNLAYTWLTVHLASWGFIVAAPEHVERDLLAVATGRGSDANHHDVKDLGDALDLVVRAGASSGNVLTGAVDGRRVAVAGHSAGGFASWRMASTDPRVRTFMEISGGVEPGVPIPTQPSLFLVGTTDHTVGLNASVKAYGAVPSPKRLVELVNAGHAVFTDACPLILQRGGLRAIVARTHLPIPDELVKLSEDGCLPTDLPAARVWPITDHFIVAHLRSVFANKAVGFGPADVAGFGPDDRVTTG